VKKISKLEDTLLEINKKFGKSTIMKVDKAKSLESRRIPTGILSLDLAIGGGLPRGRVSLLIGEKSTSKTATCLKTIATWQKYCRECSAEIKERVSKNKKKKIACKCGKNEKMGIVYLDSESSYDKEWSKKIGVNNEDVYIVQPDNLEESIEVIKAMIKSGKIDLVIFDSIAATTSITEEEKDVQDHNVGTNAKLMSKATRLITSSFNFLSLDCENKPHVIFINQFREKIGILFGDNRTLPAGKSQEYISSITIRFNHLAKIGEDGNKNPKSTPEAPINIVGQMCGFEITKNKTYPAYKKGWFTIYNQDCENLDVKKGDFDNTNQLLKYLEFKEILTKDKSTYYYKEEKLGVKKQVLEFLKNDKIYRKFLKLLEEK
jgi:recombination protein RecA